MAKQLLPTGWLLPLEMWATRGRRPARPHWHAMASGSQASRSSAMDAVPRPEARLALPADHSIRAWYGEFCKECMLRESFDEAVAADSVHVLLEEL